MKKIERLKYFLYKSNKPIYVDFFDKIVELLELNVVKIDANCTDLELNGENNQFPSWYNFLIENKDEQYTYFVIDIKNATIEQQSRFISLVKDRIYQSFELPDNCKVIVVSNENTIVNNELKGNLVIV